MTCSRQEFGMWQPPSGLWNLAIAWGSMFLRVLPLLILLSLWQASLAQGSATARLDGAPETCPVTKPYQAGLFVPPSPYPPKASAGDFWFGSDRLWTALPVNGTWRGLPHYRPSDPTFRQKLAFYREGYDWHTEPQPRLKVTGKRLDSPAPPLLSDHATYGWAKPEQTAMVTGINFPMLGCWEITGHYQDDELTFVVWVAK